VSKRPRVALLVESSRSYGRDLLHGIAEYVRLHGPWSIYLDDRGLAEVPAWLAAFDGDGIIARVENRKVGRAILDRGVPAIDLRGLLLDLEMPLIETDDEEVVRLAVAHLLERGFRHFAYCGFVGANYSDKRSESFTRRLAEAGFTPHVYQPPSQFRARGIWEWERQNLTYQDHVTRWLEELPRPVGLMACNDIRGQQVLNACREVGIAVPDEVAVIGVDNDEVLCDLSDPPLSSVVPNSRRIGYEAAALLERLMNGKPPPRETLFVKPLGIVTRHSTDVLAIEDRDVAGAVRFIREQACRGIKVEDLLAEVPLSRSVLERRFVKLLGRTPKAEILRVQLERVRQLLAETEFPLTRVAAMTGFEHPEYLSVVFRKKTGQTPGQYRAETHQRKETAEAWPRF
jgi:LacI family transcriptional regulator